MLSVWTLRLAQAQISENNKYNDDDTNDVKNIISSHISLLVVHKLLAPLGPVRASLLEPA
jgi:hypothetical protein